MGRESLFIFEDCTLPRLESCESEVLPFSGPSNYTAVILGFGRIVHAIHAILGIRGCRLLTCL